VLCIHGRIALRGGQIQGDGELERCMIHRYFPTNFLILVARVFIDEPSRTHLRPCPLSSYVVRKISTIAIT